MKAKGKKSDTSQDPLAQELDFDKLKIVSYGPGWKKVRSDLHNSKPLRENRTKLNRKSTSSKSRRRAA